MTELSVVVPTWNGGSRFVRLLEALREQDVAGPVEWLVIDSGSSDGTREAAERAGARVIQIDQREFQHGRTRNRAIAEASGEIVLLLTQDAVPMGTGYLAAMLAIFQDAPDGGAPIDAAYARQFPRPDCDPILAERLRRWSASRDTSVVQELVSGDAEASRRMAAEAGRQGPDPSDGHGTSPSPPSDDPTPGQLKFLTCYLSSPYTV